eukprot:TRINITY_DN152_c1_g1_i4.p3 TRINITY_DN152_c1_g1~~TRINITY_DN152_c1_g1_i4.p3  ORF type:complete len:229 (+),score=-12.86 TRINITY_DN152_c1_g1_i4:4148-4834(+)
MLVNIIYYQYIQKMISSHIYRKQLTPKIQQKNKIKLNKKRSHLNTTIRLLIITHNNNNNNLKNLPNREHTGINQLFHQLCNLYFSDTFQARILQLYFLKQKVINSIINQRNLHLQQKIIQKQYTKKIQNFFLQNKHIQQPSIQQHHKLTYKINSNHFHQIHNNIFFLKQTFVQNIIYNNNFINFNNIQIFNIINLHIQLVRIIQFCLQYIFSYDKIKKYQLLIFFWLF